MKIRFFTYLAVFILTISFEVIGCAVGERQLSFIEEVPSSVPADVQAMYPRFYPQHNDFILVNSHDKNYVILSVFVGNWELLEITKVTLNDNKITVHADKKHDGIHVSNSIKQEIKVFSIEDAEHTFQLDRLIIE